MTQETNTQPEEGLQTENTDGQQSTESESSEEQGSISDPVDNIIEEIAKKAGWIPPEQFKGAKPKDELLSARDYLEGNHLSSKLRSDIRDLRRTNETYGEMLRKQTESMVEERAQKILEEKRAAITEGDVEKVEAKEKEYNKTINEINQTVNADTEEDKQYYKQFIAKNSSWYNEDKDMTEYAIQLERKIAREEPSLNTKRRMQAVQQEMEDQFSEKFTRSSRNSNRDKPSAVEGKTGHVTKQPDLTFNDMPENVKGVILNYVRLAGLEGKVRTDAMNEYARDLVKSGAVSVKG